MTKLDSRKGEHVGRLDGAEQEDFTQCNMSESTIFGEIKECVFQHTDLTQADVSRCVFRNCFFGFCDMTEFDARDATFFNCEFLGCYMRDSKFMDARFEECSIESCIATHTDFKDAIFEKGTISGNFMYSKWEGAKLTEINYDKILLAGSKDFPSPK